MKSATTRVPFWISDPHHNTKHVSYLASQEVVVKILKFMFILFYVESIYVLGNTMVIICFVFYKNVTNNTIP
jgi:hypothetical protein